MIKLVFLILGIICTTVLVIELVEFINTIRAYKRLKKEIPYPDKEPIYASVIYLVYCIGYLLFDIIVIGAFIDYCF